MPNNTATDVIEFNYEMMDTKGNIIESSNGTPVSIIQGQGQLFKVLEDSMANLLVGSKRKVAVRSLEAFGAYDDDYLIRISKEELKLSAEIGEIIDLTIKDGSTIPMRVKEINKDHYLLDGNHELAGIDLLFNIEITGRRPATVAEIKSSNVQSKIN